MISCRNVANLLFSDQIETQTWWKRWDSRLHLAMCGFCLRLARQLRQLRGAAPEIEKWDDIGLHLEERLIRRLSQQ